MENEIRDNIINKYLNIKYIDEDVNFWLVRTKKGFFYDEYIDSGYIALGWNILDNNKLDKINNDDDIKLCKEEIGKVYGTKETGAIYNKCERFINEMKTGDIVMIPSHHNKYLSFAEVGDYYEEEITYIKEIEVNKRIDEGEDFGTKINCPYKKRRKINVIKTIEGTRINPNLYKVLASYHGLSSINKYDSYILSSIYNFYFWKNKLNIVINIEKEKDIKARYFSELIYFTSELLDINEEGIDIYTKSNVNSPGDVVMTIVNNVSTWAQYLSSNCLWFILLWAAFSGAKIGPIELNSIPETIIKIRNHKTESKKADLDMKLKELEIEDKEIDLDIKKEKRVNEAINKIEKVVDKIEVDTESASKIIKVDFIKKDDE